MSSIFLLLGSGVGYGTGYGTKRYGRSVLAYGVAGFGVFAYLTYKGYIDLGKIKGDFEKTLDQDGDGDFDADDMKALQEKYGKYWQKLLLLGTGFIIGFTFAIKIKRVDVEWEKY